MDGVWLVIEGRVRFYTVADKLVAELGKHEGILIPRGYKYWFESVGKEPLHILQFESIPGGGQIRTDRHAPQKLGKTRPPPKHFTRGPDGLVETEASPY
jgi:mannose-6-phosphate isomerase-like protein (cupin superfamily)